MTIYCLDHFYGGKETPVNKFDLYSAAVLLICAKMREVDTKTPFASEIKRFSDTQWNMQKLKEAEIVVSLFFDWNFMFFTYFDYLEHFCSMGILFSSDSVMSNNIKSSAIVSTCTSQHSFTTPEEHLIRKKFDAYLDSEQKQHDDNDGDFENHIVHSSEDFSHKNQRHYSFSTNKKTCTLEEFSPERREFLVSTLDQSTQRSMASKLEERCFELANKILHDMLLSGFVQINMALAILKFVRKEFGLKNHSNNYNKFLDELYKIRKINFSSEYYLIKEKYGVKKMKSNYKVSPENNKTTPEPIQIKMPSLHSLRLNSCEENFVNNTNNENMNIYQQQEDNEMFQKVINAKSHDEYQATDSLFVNGGSKKNSLYNIHCNVRNRFKTQQANIANINNTGNIGNINQNANLFLTNSFKMRLSAGATEYKKLSTEAISSTMLRNDPSNALTGNYGNFSGSVTNLNANSIKRKSYLSKNQVISSVNRELHKLNYHGSEIPTSGTSVYNPVAMSGRGSITTSTSGCVKTRPIYTSELYTQQPTVANGGLKNPNKCKYFNM